MNDIPDTTVDPAVPPDAETLDGRRPLVDLFHNLRTSRSGLSAREATHWQVVYDPNELARHTTRRWPRWLLAQLTQPLAILLALAAVLAWVGGSPALAVAVVTVVLLNAGFAFIQEMQAERAALQPVPALGIAFELAFAAAVIYTPALQHIFGTAALSPAQLAIIARSRSSSGAPTNFVRAFRRRRNLASGTSA